LPFWVILQLLDGSGSFRHGQRVSAVSQEGNGEAGGQQPGRMKAHALYFGMSPEQAERTPGKKMSRQR